MHYTPHEYQDYARKHIIDNEICGLLLEMGLGKTISTLTALDELMYDYFSIARVLIVAPKRVAKETWPAEIRKWNHTKHFKFSLILGTAKQRIKAMQEDADIYIINRENLVWLIEQYGHYVDKKRKTGFVLDKLWKFDTLVLDELSSYKEASTKRFKMLKKIRNQFNRVIGLTGTPAPNSLLDLWSQVYLLDSGERLGKTMSMYKDYYFIPTAFTRNHNGNLIATDYAPKEGAEDEIYNRIGDICISMKSIDHLQLPKVVKKVITIELEPKARRAYEELKQHSIMEYKNTIIDAQSAAGLSNKLHQMAQGAIYDDEKKWQLIHDEKLQALDEIIESAQGKSLLVFYWFKSDFDRLRARYSFSKTLDDKNIIDEWNNGRVRLLLAHPGSAGHGLNLQHGGHNIVWFSLTWSLELYLQSNARLDRQGQNHPVTLHHLIVKDSVDESIMEVLEGKKKQQDALMDAVKAVLKGGR